MNKRTGGKIKTFLKRNKISVRSIARELRNSKGELYSHSTISYFLQGKLKSKFLEDALIKKLEQIKEEAEYGA